MGEGSLENRVKCNTVRIKLKTFKSETLIMVKHSLLHGIANMLDIPLVLVNLDMIEIISVFI